MTIICKLCSAKLLSYGISRDEAVREAIGKLDTHVRTAHADTIEKFKLDIGKACLLITTYGLVDTYGIIPDTEPHLQKVHETCADTILSILGLEIEEEKTDDKEVTLNQLTSN